MPASAEFDIRHLAFFRHTTLGIRHSLSICAVLFWFSALDSFAQGTNALLTIRPESNAWVISWTGRSTLQTAIGTPTEWLDVLGATSPYRVFRTNQAPAQVFRAISRWGRRANLLEANSEMSVAELDRKIYVFGGYPSSRITVRTVQVYDVDQNRWSLTTPLPIPLNHSMAAAANGRLYLIGGQTHSGGGEPFTNTVFEYNPATSNWTTRAPMPTSRSSGAAAVIGDLIYVAGGRPPRGQDFAVYNVVSNQWTTLPNLPTGRNHLGAGAIDGKVYVAGGRLGSGFTSPMTNIVEVYDPATRLWSTRAPMLIPRGGINSIVADGCLFLVGGEGADGVFGQNEMYVPNQNRWYRLEPLPVPVHGVTGAAYVEGLLYFPGGGTATGGSSGSVIHQVFWLGNICP